MSNSFDRVPDEAHETLSAVLAAMADELTRTATDVETLGETLSGRITDPEALRKSYNIQAFDLLSQAVQAQARLLRRLSTLPHAEIPANMAGMIADVPFSQTRQRLLAAVNGAVPPAVDDAHDDAEVNWF